MEQLLNPVSADPLYWFKAVVFLAEISAPLNSPSDVLSHFLEHAHIYPCQSGSINIKIVKQLKRVIHWLCSLKYSTDSTLRLVRAALIDQGSPRGS